MNASAPPRARWSRARVLVVVVLLLLVPVGLGAGLGWYGLNGPMEERLNPVGAFAHELLNGVPDDRLVVEIAAPSGELPAAASISVLWSRMNETLQKGSIDFQLETYGQASGGALTTDGLFALEDQVRQTWPTVGTMSLFYLVVAGSYAGGSSVIGLAYAGSSIAMFASTIPGGIASNPGVVSTVLVHEFGHEIGLVGVVGSASNEDPNHPGHSNDPNDVMYWQVETTAILGGLLGGQGPPTQFDAADLADLQTVRSTPIGQEILPWVVVGVVLAAAIAVVVAWSRQGRRPRA